MTFKQFDINFNCFKYIVESNGIFVRQTKIFAVKEKFVPFEEVGSNIRRYRERKLGWLIVSLLFFLLAFGVFIDRMNGAKVGDYAEAFWFVTGLVFFVVYAFRRKNNLFLVKENTGNKIEFIGTKIYERRLNQFIEDLHEQRDIYLKSKYPAYDGLNLDENIICVQAGIQLHDGLLLKKLTKHPLQELRFGNGYTKTGKPLGICSMTTEKNARKITCFEPGKVYK